jgi:hypothetical protein
MTSRRPWFFKPPSEPSSKEGDETYHLSRSLDLGAEPSERLPGNFPSTSFTSFPFELDSSWRPATPEQERPTPDTVTTQDSFDTAPEISEPVEKLIEALLNSKKPKQPEVTINVMAEGEKADVVMDNKT